MTHSGHGNWGQNLLKNTLYNGDTATIRYDDIFTYFDVKLVFNNNVTREWKHSQEMYLSSAWKITIYYNGKNLKGEDMFGLKIHHRQNN